jgi:hypothetical protein
MERRHPPRAARGRDTRAQRYYEEYLDDTTLTARAIGEGFAFQGEVMKFRRRPRGETSTHLPPTAFVAFIQNHDQVGNRAFGERLGMLAPAPKLRAVAAVYLLAPQIPMLFMARNGMRASRFSSSRISTAISPTRSAMAGARNSRACRVRGRGARGPDSRSAGSGHLRALDARLE